MRYSLFRSVNNFFFLNLIFRFGKPKENKLKIFSTTSMMAIRISSLSLCLLQKMKWETEKKNLERKKISTKDKKKEIKKIIYEKREKYNSGLMWSDHPSMWVDAHEATRARLPLARWPRASHRPLGSSCKVTARSRGLSRVGRCWVP